MSRLPNPNRALWPNLCPLEEFIPTNKCAICGWDCTGAPSFEGLQVHPQCHQMWDKYKMDLGTPRHSIRASAREGFKEILHLCAGPQVLLWNLSSVLRERGFPTHDVDKDIKEDPQDILNDEVFHRIITKAKFKM